MKTILRVSGIILLIILIHSCKKDEDDAIKDDIGNVYTSVEIGTQVWLAENLKTTKYNDGTPIPHVTDAATWNNLSTPAYCWYDNSEALYKDIYGALYNWYSVNTGNLCPAGWHVPSHEEWTTLENYLIDNGYNYDGTTINNRIGKALASNTLWTSSTNTGSVGNSDYPDKINATGFTAFPGGYRYNDGEFDFMGMNAFWWTVTTSNADWAYSRELEFDYPDFFTFNDPKKAGFSVRCVKDN
jgi:uncharacterized protein (TIGR02145 family)